MVYVTADGGSIGRGQNSAIALLAAAGRISAIPPVVTINEQTTVAAIHSLAPFMDPRTATIVGAPPTNAQELDTAFGVVANLVELSAGAATPSADVFTPIFNPVTHASEALPERTLESLGDILSACVESFGPTSLGCATLLALASPPSGTQPTNTRQALFVLSVQHKRIARFPPGFHSAIERDSALEPNLTQRRSRKR